MKELTCIGPPGTGKTSRLTDRIIKAVKKFGSSQVLVSSFTKAASKEIASRGIPVHRKNVGTLHSLCFHALNKPQIAEGHIDEFNKEFSHFSLTGEKKDIENPYGREQIIINTRGDALSSKMQNLRARMIDKKIWPSNILAFSSAWEKWKEKRGYLDFTDLIEKTIENFPFAHGNPAVGFFDEAQDFTRLQMTLVRQWARAMHYVLVAGDDDQLLYDFAGATPDAFLDPSIPESHKEVLSQSYRVPVKIHAIANKWIQQISNREKKEYFPRDFEGQVKFGLGSCANPGLFINEVEKIVKDKNETVMILASCSYMLNSTINTLRKRGLPFHNPFRKINAAWNPLQRRQGATMTIDRLSSFTNPTLGFPPVWSMEDISNFIGHMSSKDNIIRGAKNLPKEHLENKIEMPEKLGNGYNQALKMFFKPEIVDQLIQQLENGPDPNWYLDKILSTKRKPYEFPMQIYKKIGEAALKEKPKIIVGTIHSVKGGEADNVILMPDLSSAGMRQWTQRGKYRDAIIRMTYVAMTRARNNLQILRPAGALHIDLSSIRNMI